MGGASDVDNAIADNLAEGIKQGKHAADALDSTVSDLKYLRDAAERRSTVTWMRLLKSTRAACTSQAAANTTDGMMRAFCENIGGVGNGNGGLQ